MLEQAIKEELIFLNETAADRAELFRKISDIYFEKGYVKEGFHDYLSNREDTYPTGLALESHTAAIPHGDPEYINKPFISVITMQKPIKMNKMEDPDAEIDVELLFVLGLADGGQHLEILRGIIGLLQHEDIVDRIKAATSTQDIMNEIAAASNQ